MLEKTVEQEMKIFQDSMDIEEAKDLCLAAQKKYLRAIAEEEDQQNPEAAFVQFCEESIASLSKLRRDIKTADARTIARIKDKESLLFRHR